MTESGLGPLAISAQVAPCMLHAAHSPINVISELHHWLPEYLQRRAWGETVIDERVPICATSHNTVHAAIDAVLVHSQPIPGWATGRTRRLVVCALEGYRMAQAGSSPAQIVAAWGLRTWPPL